MRYLIAAFALLGAAPCFAHAIWWQRPTHYTSGLEIGANEVVSTIVEWSDGETFTEVHGSRTVSTASSANMPDPTSTRCYRVRAVVAGEVSEPSNVWCKVIGQAPPARRIPNPPTGLSGD